MNGINPAEPADINFINRIFCKRVADVQKIRNRKMEEER